MDMKMRSIATSRSRMWAVIPALAVAGLMLGADPARGSDLSVPHINGDAGRLLMGDGTDVIVGIIDSGVDATHPALAGLDSLGRPRLVATGNFVTTEPGNTGGDLANHGTSVMSVVGSSDAVFTGMAPDTRYINARTLNASNGFNTTAWVENAAGFALDNGASVLNLSLGTFDSLSSGTLDLDRMLDWAAHERGILSVVAAGNDGDTGDPQVGSPGGAFNVITVGATTAPGYDQVASFSSVGLTDDGRGKPDVVAPGVSITMASANWESGSDFRTASGTSFAAPHVSGLVAQQLEYGRTHGHSTDPRVLKATILNSAQKVLDKNGAPWSPTAAGMNGSVFEVISPLDNEQGTGQVDALALYDQYSAGEQGPGVVEGIGWDFNTVVGETFVDYVFGAPLEGGSTLSATLAWFRSVDIAENGDGVLSSLDSFTATPLDDLDLTLLLDDAPLAISMSDVDPLEHLYFELPETGNYTLRVSRDFVSGSGDDELYALAWSGVMIPEPGALTGLVAVGLLALRRRGR